MISVHQLFGRYCYLQESLLYRCTRKTVKLIRDSKNIRTAATKDKGQRQENLMMKRRQEYGCQPTSSAQKTMKTA